MKVKGFITSMLYTRVQQPDNWRSRVLLCYIVVVIIITWWALLIGSIELTFGNGFSPPLSPHGIKKAAFFGFSDSSFSNSIMAFIPKVNS